MKLKCRNHNCNYKYYTQFEKDLDKKCPKCNGNLFFAVTPRRLKDEYEVIEEIKLLKPAKRVYKDIDKPVEYDPRIYKLRSINNGKKYLWFTYWVTNRKGNLGFGGQYGPILSENEAKRLLKQL